MHTLRSSKLTFNAIKGISPFKPNFAFFLLQNNEISLNAYKIRRALEFQVKEQVIL